MHDCTVLWFVRHELHAQFGCMNLANGWWRRKERRVNDGGYYSMAKCMIVWSTPLLWGMQPLQTCYCEKNLKRFLKSIRGSNCDCVWSVHILESLEVLKRWNVFAISSFTEFIEYRDKCFVLDLKLLFIIVDFFLRRFLPTFFTVIFLGHHILSYLLFHYTWYWCLFIWTMIIHNRSN